MTRPVIIALLLLAALLVTGAAAMSTTLRADFEQYKRTFGKSYSTPDEEERRFAAYAHNMMHTVPELRRRNPHATFGETVFSDKMPEELRASRAGMRDAIARGATEARRSRHVTVDYQPTKVLGRSADSLPAAIDWSKLGAVTPVKNQADCGSCWSFSTTGNIEGQWYLAGNALTSLSEQMLVSCDHLFSFGCNGGFSLMAYIWLIDANNGWIAPEASYPYVSGNGKVPPCTINTSTTNPGLYGGAQITGGRLLLPWVASEMKAFVAYEGPLSVAMDADTLSSYTGGVITDCAQGLPDHQVLITGYNVTTVTVPGTNQTRALESWTVKNSWGSTFGVDGYFFVEIGRNLCQLELLPNSASVRKNP